jgi:hypothetical protein
MNLLKLPVMNQALSIALRTNTDDLLKALSRFDYPAFNSKPSVGGWGAGEITEHLLLFDVRVNTVLSGNTVPADRDPQEKVNAFQERLADRENKIDAPPFLLPSGISQDPAALTDKILVERRKLSQSILETDLSLTYPDTPHRLFGVLTGIEWIQLLIHHCNRHLIQLAALNNG